jgi:hypothetical protein
VSNDEPLDDTIDLTGASRRLNGNGRSPVDPAVPAGLEGVTWSAAYDRASVERYLESLDADRTLLEAEIAEAERRTSAARDALAARTAELEAALGAVVLAARSQLERIDREQQEAVAAIRAEAEAEAARIREAARQEAETVRAAASSLSALAQTEGRTDAG